MNDIRIEPPLSIEQEYYKKTARLYDSAYSEGKDVTFYVDLAKASSGKVLEVACGTGRVLIPTARAGVEIDGIDFSAALLSVLKEKLVKEPLSVQQKVSVWEGDMRTFSLSDRYSLITVPFRPLQHLFTVDEQVAAFRRFHEHLLPGGTLAFNVFFPDFAALDRVGEENVDFEWVDPVETGTMISRSFLRITVDKLNQVVKGESIFRFYRNKDLVKEERAVVRMSYYTYPQLRLLLKSTGFQVAAEYGSFDKDPISIQKEMIIVAEKIIGGSAISSEEPRPKEGKKYGDLSHALAEDLQSSLSFSELKSSGVRYDAVLKVALNRLPRSTQNNETMAYALIGRAMDMIFGKSGWHIFTRDEGERRAKYVVGRPKSG